MKNNKFIEYLIKYPILNNILTQKQKCLLCNLNEYNYTIKPYYKAKYNLEYILNKAKKYKKSINEISRFYLYFYIGKNNDSYYIYKVERSFKKIFKNKGHIYIENNLNKYEFE